MVVPKGATHPRPVLPEPSEPIIIGGLHAERGSGGLHSADRPALYRTDAEYQIYEADVCVVLSQHDVTVRDLPL